MERDAAAEDAGRVVLHIDLDCFFVQVHRHLDPRLEEKAVVLQQHQAGRTFRIVDADHRHDHRHPRR